VIWTGQSAGSDVLFLHSFQTKRTPFPFTHFPFIPRIRGCAASFPLYVCNLWVDLLQSWICFIISSPHPRLLTHPQLARLWSVFSQVGVIYTSPFMHLTRYMIHVVQVSLSSSPLPPPSPNIFSLAPVRILRLPVFPPLPASRWDRRGLRVACWVVIARVLRVCNAVCSSRLWGRADCIDVQTSCWAREGELHYSCD